MIVGEIKGTEQLIEMLRRLPNAMDQENVMLKALRAGGDIIRNQAEANLVANGSVDTGLLSEHILVVSNTKRKAPGRVEVIVKPTTKLSMVIRKGKHTPSRARPSKYAHFVEYGTEHSVAKPFLRPAVAGKGDEAGQVIEAEVQKGVAQVAAKLGLT